MTKHVNNDVPDRLLFLSLALSPFPHTEKASREKRGGKKKQALLEAAALPQQSGPRPDYDQVVQQKCAVAVVSEQWNVTASVSGSGVPIDMPPCARRGLGV
jgi:hypothetical protein